METKNIAVEDLATGLKKYSNLELHKFEIGYQGNPEIVALVKAERDRRLNSKWLVLVAIGIAAIITTLLAKFL